MKSNPRRFINSLLILTGVFLLLVLGWDQLMRVNLVVRNESGVPVCEIYVRKHGKADWGIEILGTQGTDNLNPGGSTVLRLKRDRYDLLAVDCLSFTLEELTRVSVGINRHYDQSNWRIKGE